MVVLGDILLQILFYCPPLLFYSITPSIWKKNSLFPPLIATAPGLSFFPSLFTQNSKGEKREGTLRNFPQMQMEDNSANTPLRFSFRHHLPFFSFSSRGDFQRFSLFRNEMPRPPHFPIFFLLLPFSVSFPPIFFVLGFAASRRRRLPSRNGGGVDGRLKVCWNLDSIYTVRWFFPKFS